MASLSDILSPDRLPAMPAAMARVLPMVLDHESDLLDLENVIRTDEALTAAVLRMANSAMYGVSGQQFDLRRSIARMGRYPLQRCVLQQQTSQLLAGDNDAFGLQRGATWRSSLAGAIAAEELAREHSPDDVPLAFVCGLMRDIGKLALNVTFGKDYLSLTAAHHCAGRSFVEVELDALGFDHALIGAALARQWCLPERIAAAIEWHHAPPAPGPAHDPLYDIVHAADMICLWAGPGLGIDGLDYRLAEHVRENLNLTRRSVEHLIAVVWQKMTDEEQALGTSGEQQGAAA